MQLKTKPNFLNVSVTYILCISKSFQTYVISIFRRYYFHFVFYNLLDIDVIDNSKLLADQIRLEISLNSVYVAVSQRDFFFRTDKKVFLHKILYEILIVMFI